jgi:hypothetical protein
LYGNLFTFRNIAVLYFSVKCFYLGSKRAPIKPDMVRPSPRTVKTYTERLQEMKSNKKYSTPIIPRSHISGAGRTGEIFLNRHLNNSLLIIVWIHSKFWGRRDCDCMVVGFTTTYAISAYHHWHCECELRSWRGVLDATLCDKVCQWLGTG